MAGIIGLLDILHSGFRTFSSDDVQEILNDLRQSAYRLNRTLRNYLLILDLQTATPDVVTTILGPNEVGTNVFAGVEEVLRLNTRREDVTVRVKRQFLFPYRNRLLKPTPDCARANSPQLERN